MRSKAPLALIEQAVMLLVFALAAVLCLKAFVWADTQSAASVQRDRALLAAQNAAEILKHCQGDFEEAAQFCGGTWNGEVWTVRYDEAWKTNETSEAYLLVATPADSDLKYLGMASIRVFWDEICLAQLDIAWQEVGGHG